MQEICLDNFEKIIESTEETIKTASRALANASRGVVLTFNDNIFYKAKALFHEGAALQRGLRKGSNTFRVSYT